MKKFTKLIMLMMFMSSTVLMGQTAAFNTNSDEEAQMRQQRRTPSLHAQTQAVPSHKLEAKSSTTFTVPSEGSRAISNIKIEVTADYWYDECSYNLWSYDDGAYYWATDQIFATSNETITHVLPLTEGNAYSVDCFDSYGDGGIAGVVSNDDTGWFIMNWGSNDYADFGEFNFTAWEGYAPPVYLPITAFPFEADFEDGVLSGDEYVQPITDTYSGAYLSANAADASLFGFMMEGGSSSTGWTGSSTTTTYDNAFTDNVTHQSELLMEVHPDLANTSDLFMTFDFRQNYSFGYTYEWFRVLVDGVPVEATSTDAYWNPSSYSSDPWQNLTFDLTAFKNLASFEVILQSAGKYYYGYSGGGDVAMIDNIDIFYIVPGLEIVNVALDMGDRPIGAWMKDASFEIVNNPGVGNLSISQADIDDNFGGFLVVKTPTLPFTLVAGDTTCDFGVATTEEVVTDGAFAGNFALFYGGARAIATATYSGNAYTPDAGDVWELFLDGNAATYPVSVPMGTFCDNYDMPGADDDGWDVVYEFTFAYDALLNATLAATNAKIALYPVGFEGVGGPDFDNELFAGTTALVDLELAAGTYYLVVSTTGADYDLDVTYPEMDVPVVATYVAPVNGATGIINGDDLVWIFGDYTVEYQVMLGTTYPPTTVVVEWTDDLAEAYTLVNTQPNLQYFWQINTRNSNGQTLDPPIWIFTATISPPTGLEVTLNDLGESFPTVSTSLVWDAPATKSFLGYNVFCNGVQINTALLDVESYADPDLARDAFYTYWVTSVYDQGESLPSNDTTVTALGVGTFDGEVTDVLTGDSIPGASVNIFGTDYSYYLTTDSLGEYSTLAYTGTYDIGVSADGFNSATAGPIVLTHGATETNDFALTETPLPVGDVVAEEISDDEVLVSWGDAPPAPIMEWLGYGGETHDANWWLGAGAAFTTAMNFDPVDLIDVDGTSLTKFSIYNYNCDNANVTTLMIYEGDLEGGTATLLHEQPIVDLTLVSWNEIELTVPIPIDVTQTLWVVVDRPAATCGTSASSVDYNENGDWIYYGGAWTHLANFGYNDVWNMKVFATNVLTRGSTQLVRRAQEPLKDNTANAQLENLIEEGDIGKNITFRPEFNTRGVVSYDVYRNKVYQPETAILVGNTIQQDFVDFDWGIQDWGVYRWSVVVNYDAGQVSVPTYSNTLETDMEILVSATVTTNSGDSPAGTMVAFTNTSELDAEGLPIYIFSAILDETGAYAWDDFRRGVYDIEVLLPGFTGVDLTDIEIFDESDFEWMLEEIIATPGNLYVTPTGWATWVGNTGGGGAFEPFLETFDGVAVDELPAGWTTSPETGNWGVDDDDDAGGVAPQMRFYFSPSGTVDDYYLMTPIMSTEGQSTLEFSFKSFIDDYSYGDPYNTRVVAIADGVEYIIQEWIDPGDIGPEDLSYTLTDAHGVGAEEFQLAWVYEGDPWEIMYWYIDDVMLNGARGSSKMASRAFNTYKVYLDGVLITDVDKTEYQYGTNGEVLVKDSTYTAGVAAVYTMGQSATAEFDWVYIPCDEYAPPTAFTAAQVEGTLNILLEWTNVDVAALDTIDGVNVYRDGDLYDFVDFTGGVVNTFTDGPLEFGTYSYCITYIYASGAETCQGVVCSGDVELDGNAAVDGFVFQDEYLGGAPIEGAKVQLVNVDSTDIVFTFYADSTGAYGGVILADTYDYEVSAWGYITETLEDVVIPFNGLVSNTFELDEFPAPPVNVVATELNDDEVLLTWNNPQFSQFEPYVADMSTGVPAGWVIDPVAMPTWFWTESDGGNQLGGKPFMFADSDAAGPGSTMQVYMTTPVIEHTMGEPLLLLSFDQYYNNLSSSESADVEVFDGQNWVTVLHQNTDQGSWTSPSHKVIDVSVYVNPDFQVRFYYHAPGWDWYWAVNNVVVTNAVTRTGEPVLTSKPTPTRDMTGYEIYRTTCETGDLQFMGAIPATDSLFTDHTWGAADPNIYKWGVVAIYEQNDSEIAFSNCLDKDMYTIVSVTVTTNDSHPEGTFVEFTNISEPDLGIVYDVLLDETGYYAWDEFRLGDYDIFVEKPGFGAIEIAGEPIWEPTDFAWFLEEEILPVENLHVNPNALATWAGEAPPPPPPGPTIIIEENFDSYTAGDFVAVVSPYFTTWSNDPGGSEDAYVTDLHSSSPANSVEVILNNDLVLIMEDYTTGFYTYEMKMYVPTGYCGYFNLQKTSTPGQEWAFQIYYQTDGVALGDAGAAGAITHAFNHDEWMDLKVEVDLDNDWATYYFNDEEIYGYQWTLGTFGTPGLLSFGGANIFGGANSATSDTPLFYMDDVVLSIPPEVSKTSRELEYYKVWLDGIFVEDVIDTYYQYDVTPLVPDQEYFTEVAAMFTNGMSEKMDYTWIFMPCDSFPGPSNLAGEVQDVYDVFLTWSAEGGVVPPPPELVFITQNPGAPVNGYYQFYDNGYGVVYDLSAYPDALANSIEFHHASWGTFGPFEYNIHIINWDTEETIAVLGPFTTTVDDAWELDVDLGDVDLNGATDVAFLMEPLSNSATDAYPCLSSDDAVNPQGSVFGPLDDIGSIGASEIGNWLMNIYIMTANRPVRVTSTELDVPAAPAATARINVNNAFVTPVIDNQTASVVNVFSTSVGVNAEQDLNAEPRTIATSRALWDTQYSFDIDGPSGLTGLAGAESDGEFIYAPKWAGSEIVKFTVDGSYVETFTISGVSGLRDLAFDGTYMYGAAASTTVFKMDFTTHTLISSFTAPTAVRAIAYDDDNNAFWGNNWSTDLVLFDESGATLNTISAPPSMYGTAYDNFTVGGPFLWIFTGTSTGGGCQIEQIDIATGNVTGVSHSVSDDFGAYIAGGLYITEDLVTGKRTIGGTAQGTPDLAFGYEIGDTGGGGGGGGFDPGPVIGANVYRDGILIAGMVQDTFYLDMALDYGMYEYCVNLLYEEGAESCAGTCVDVEVTEDCVPPEELTATLEGDNLVHLLWDQEAPSEWLFYHDGSFENGFCSTAGGAGIAQVFTPAEHPVTITEVRYFNDAYGNPGQETEVYLLSGDGATILAGPYSVIGESGDTFVTVDIDDVTLEAGTFMVYTANVIPDGPFIGVDESFYNGTLYFGSVGSFTELGTLGYFYIGSHEALVTYGALSANVVPNSTVLRPANAVNNSSALAVSNHAADKVVRPTEGAQSRSFIGYNIYKNGVLLEALLTDNFYDYDEMQNGHQCYTVTAEYSYCGESDPSNEACIDITVGIDEIGENEVSLYPNPAVDYINIVSSKSINTITVFDYLGQVIYEMNVVEDNNIKLNTASYGAGVYFIKVYTEEGITVKRVIITR